MKRSITIFTLIILSVAARAQSNDFTYTRPDGSWFHCIVTSDSTVSVNSGNTDTLGRLIFPDTVTNGINTYVVTAIANSAFSGANAPYVYISNTIKHIGDSAFYCMNKNDSVTIGTGVTYIGDYAFLRRVLYTIRYNAVNCQYFGPNVFEGIGGSMGLIDTLFIGDSVITIPPALLHKYEDVVLIYSSHLQIDSTTFSHFSYSEKWMHIEMRCPPPVATPHSLDYLIRKGWGVYVPCDMLSLYENDSVWSQVSLHPRVPFLTLYHAEVLEGPTCDNHQVTISATSQNGWHFSEWSDGNTDSLRTLTVDSDLTLRACFEPNIDSSRYFKYFTFEDETEDTMWSRSVTTPCASWWIGPEGKINGNRGLYVGGVRRDDGTAPVGMGGGGGYAGGPGSRGTLYAYTNQSFLVPEGMYYYSHDSYSQGGSGSLLLVALIPDSAAVPLLSGEDYTMPDNTIYFIDGQGIGNERFIWVPDSGYYRLLIVYGYRGLHLSAGDTIGAVIDNIFFERQDSVIISTSGWNNEGWIEGGGTFAYGDSVTVIAHPGSGYRFVRWFNGDTNIVMHFVARCNTWVSAVFEPDSFYVTIDITGQNVSVGSLCGRGTSYNHIIRCCDSGEYTCPTIPWGWVSVELIPDSGYVFYAWRDGNMDNPRRIRMSFNHDTVLRPIVIPIDTSYRVGYGFENPARDSDWVLVNGSNINRWVIDTAVHSEGNRSLYISNDGGQTNQYDLLPEDNVCAYTTLHLDAATIYEWSYDWRGGRCNIDFVHMALCSDSVGIVEGQGMPDNMSFIAPGMCGSSGWNSTSGYFNTIDSGDYKLVFHWSTFGWDIGISDMAGAIDNVAIRSVGPLQWVMINASGRNGSVAGHGYHRIGDTVTLVAIPHEHFHFVQWENGDTNRVRQFVATNRSGELAYIAQFDPDAFMVNVVPNDSLYSVNGTGVYYVDYYSENFPTATLTVVPTYGNMFLSWTDGNTDNPRQLLIDRDTLLQPIVVPIDSIYLRQPVFGTGFEDTTEDSLWVLLNGNLANAWIIGNAAHSSGSRGLYISNDGGISNNYYNQFNESMVYAYYNLHLTAGTYSYVFDWRCNGELYYADDYMRVILFDTSTVITTGMGLPSGGIALDGGNRLWGSSEWQTIQIFFTITQESDYLLTFYWVNDIAEGYYPAAGVDNICIERLIPIEDFVPPVVEVYESICEGDSLSFYGTTYSESGSYDVHTHYHAYDDTVYTLHLAVNYSDITNMVDTICEGEMYSFNGRQLTSAGLYGDTLQTAQGCDSVVMLSLTINPVSETTFTEAACDSFTWIDGVTYTASTSEPTVTVNNVYGCDSVITLHLTIHYSSYDTVVDSATGSYTWQGNTYTESGEYLYQSQTEAGCDSIIVLQLTINAVGIALADSLGEVAVFPNPTTGRLSIVTDSEQQVGRVEVFDQGGRVVGTFLGTNEIDIRHLPTGTYTLRITLQNGSAIKRVIKQ